MQGACCQSDFLLLLLFLTMCLPHAASNLHRTCLHRTCLHTLKLSLFAGSIGSLYSIGAQPMLASCYILPRRQFVLQARQKCIRLVLLLYAGASGSMSVSANSALRAAVWAPLSQNKGATPAGAFFYRHRRHWRLQSIWRVLSPVASPCWRRLSNQRMSVFNRQRGLCSNRYTVCWRRLGGQRVLNRQRGLCLLHRQHLRPGHGLCGYQCDESRRVRLATCQNMTQLLHS